MSPKHNPKHDPNPNPKHNPNPNPNLNHNPHLTLNSRLGLKNKKLLNNAMMEIIVQTFPSFYLDGHAEKNNPLLAKMKLRKAYGTP
jgi:hypothetical protein